MISEDSFSENWIKTNFEKQGIRADKNKFSFTEKMNHAILLAELLKIHGLDFIFKGGTSLILLLDKPQRFSIDLDIITNKSQEDIENILGKICQNSCFTSFELDERKSIGVPKIHYYLYFRPKFSHSPNDGKIVLDIVFSKNPYPQIQEVDIQKDWIVTKNPIIKITIPTIESITGDKLTAFAPNTTGILYGKGKHIEIIKQMFDLGQLFDKITAFEIVSASFYQNVEKELAYRHLDKSADEVLDDIFQTCLDIINCYDEKNKMNSKMQELKNGIIAFESWTIGRFKKEEAFEIAGKVAYIAAKIKYKDFSKPKKFETNMMKIANFEIKMTKFNFLNKKVKYANHALFYWNQAIDILSNSLQP